VTKVLDSLRSATRSCFFRAVSGVAAKGGKGLRQPSDRASGNVASHMVGEDRCQINPNFYSTGFCA
jgi:hypothetical protein